MKAWMRGTDQRMTTLDCSIPAPDSFSWRKGFPRTALCLRGNDGWKKRVMIIGMMLVVVTLAGCGKKGPPGPPPGVPNTYPQNYPQQ
jgi:predicted small lipoprotein YifL